MTPFAGVQNRGPMTRSLGVVAALAVIIGGLTLAGAPPAVATAASGGPGALSHFDLARKDCVGTARNTTSKVWYTVADGVLSDVYYPTIDNTNVETLQYVVTDGRTFTDLQTRDMTYTAKPLDRSGLVCRVTSRDKHDRYSLITDYITDPSRASVVMHTTFYPKHPGTLALYARYDATVNGNGGGAPATEAPTTRSSTPRPGRRFPSHSTPTPPRTQRTATTPPRSIPPCGPADPSSRHRAGTSARRATASRRWTPLTHSAPRTGAPATATSCRPHASTWVTATPSVSPSGSARTQSAAVDTAGRSATTNFDRLSAQFRGGWWAYDSALNRPPHLKGLSGRSVPSLQHLLPVRQRAEGQ